jgi:predicted transcriptional regulator
VEREEISRHLGMALSQSGYEYFFCSGSHSCFDVAARREKLFLVKVLENIDSHSEGHAQSLRSVASLLHGQDFVLGERSRVAELDDDVIYERHGTPASNLPTFRRILENEMPSARKQKRLVFSIDGERLRMRREEAEMSLSKLAEESGISRATLFRYEKSMTSATGEHAERLVALFGKEILAPVQAGTRHARSFRFFGMKAARASGPFNVLATESEERIMVGEEQDMRTLEKRSALFAPLSGILSSYPCFLLRKAGKRDIGGVPVITQEEIEEAEKPLEIIKLVKERRR